VCLFVHACVYIYVMGIGRVCNVAARTCASYRLHVYIVSETSNIFYFFSGNIL